jgi:hypothetical protein
MIHAHDLQTFNKVLRNHENVVARALNYPKVKDLYFSDFWGEVKSLGAWGGDFAMVTSDRAFSETLDYFSDRNFSTLIPFSEIIYMEFFL